MASCIELIPNARLLIYETNSVTPPLSLETSMSQSRNKNSFFKTSERSPQMVVKNRKFGYGQINNTLGNVNNSNNRRIKIRVPRSHQQQSHKFRFHGFWPYCSNFGPVTTHVVGPQTVTPSLSVPAPYIAVSSNCGNNANKSSSPVISHPQDHNHESDPEDSDEEERVSVAPGSQEEGLSVDEEGDTLVQDSQNVSQPSVPVSINWSVFYQFQ
ncbi:unnamed protein product [Mytilus coruscus]|uniref:Uncharacterized protein n=1 Tax=Mytilus coruscus TaxID=42192 RepID=A0A6J8AFF5_MYTCO|nr:unnamed protein product [Mytilus coruscus]